MNMGSTSTKVAVYEDRGLKWSESITHPGPELRRHLAYMDQYDLRLGAVMGALAVHGDRLGDFTVFVSRGGCIGPVPGGVWRINQEMLDDSQCGYFGDHPCNIGGQIAFDLAREHGREAFTVDPPACGEFRPEALYSGLPEIERLGAFQVLNHRAAARRYARDAGRSYAELSLIVAHMGGGITVAAHHNGKIIDANNGLAGDGPMAMERAGGLPTGELIKICYSGRYTLEEMLRRVNGQGGMLAYVGQTDARIIQEMIDARDQAAEAAVRAMAYQVAKEIGALGAVLGGRVDAIVLTAGLAHWKFFTALIRERVEFIAPVHLYPGENEMESLMEGVWRHLQGEEPAQDYRTLVPPDHMARWKAARLAV
jgi:butyrate kinase